MTALKAFGALAGAIVFMLYSGPITDGHLTAIEWVELVGFVLATLGTYIVGNSAGSRAAKTWVHALVIGSGVLALQLVDGWQTTVDLGPVLIGILTSAGVYVLPGPDRMLTARRPNPA